MILTRMPFIRMKCHGLFSVENLYLSFQLTDAILNVVTVLAVALPSTLVLSAAIPGAALLSFIQLNVKLLSATQLSVTLLSIALLVLFC